jgi:hypothetical protein
MLVWSYHHIILDGWSMGLILNVFLEIYYQLKKGISLQMPPAITYSTYIKWLENREKDASFNYWRNYLDGLTCLSRFQRNPHK